MIFLVLINFFIKDSIFGYAYLFKDIFFKNNNFFIVNLDFFYGLIFLYLLSLLFTFLQMAMYSKKIVLIGLIYYYIVLIKNKLKINFI